MLISLISTVPSNVTLVMTAVTFWKKWPLVAVVVLALEPLMERYNTCLVYIPVRLMADVNRLPHGVSVR